MKQRLRDLEARELWIEARVDELMDDETFVEQHDYCGPVSCREHAYREACYEHGRMIASMEEAIIDSMELKR